MTYADINYSTRLRYLCIVVHCVKICFTACPLWQNLPSYWAHMHLSLSQRPQTVMHVHQILNRICPIAPRTSDKPLTTRTARLSNTNHTHQHFCSRNLITKFFKLQQVYIVFIGVITKVIQRNKL
jgi:hypothetical protein